MLPSMPILFTRDSQDAFGNRIEPSTSFFTQNVLPKSINPEPPPAKEVLVCKVPVKDAKKTPAKKKQDPPKLDYNHALVKAYYTKVQSKFATHQTVPTNKFIQFQNILRTYNPRKETPVDLYKKVESLFGEQHKEFVEEFLLFLTPGQAASVGRFMDRFALIQMSSFIQLLQNTFTRKPTVLRKILRAISTGIKSGNSSIMKTRVLPHLRSSPKLIQMYKALFPDERPPESWSDSGATLLNQSFLKSDTGCDYWEIKEENNDKKQKNDVETTRLDTLYHHGRIFLKQGRMVRAACVSYPFSKEPYRVHLHRLTSSTNNYISLTESDDETNSSKRRNTAKIPPKKSKKQSKSPTKTVKDVNDNNKHKENTINSPKAKGKSNSRTKNVKDKKDADCKLDLPKTKREKCEIKNLTDSKDDNKTKLLKSEASTTCTIIKKEKHDGKSSNEDIKIKQEISQSKNKTSNGHTKKSSDKNTHKPDDSSDKISKTKQTKAESIKIIIINNEVKDKVIKTKIIDEINEDAKTKKPRTEIIKAVNKELQVVDRKLNAEENITGTDSNKTNDSNIIMTCEGNEMKTETARIDSMDQKVTVKASSWTRDEDKIMLQIMKGEAGSDQVFRRIHDHLPHRSVTDIRERFCQVMSLWQKMAVGEVT